jgi:epoxyqueuosine reductase
MNVNPDTVWIEAGAKRLGFDLCGVVRAAKFPELARTEEWLERGFAGEMRYLSDPRRRNAESVLPGIRSVIVCALNYNTAFPRSTEVRNCRNDQEPRGWISRYAWGVDYHEVLDEKLGELARSLRERFAGPFETRVYADTGPVQERIFAKYAGLGWLGKNTLLLNQRLGSWFFLGAILTTLDLSPSLEEGALPAPDLCGSCRRCIDACPTDAFVEPYVMDARRCISYLTIELRGAIPDEFREPLGTNVFGCDICQDVCPWNRRAPVSFGEEFQPRHFLQELARPMTAEREASEVRSVQERQEPAPTPRQSLFWPHLETLASMDEKEFRQVFRGSPVKRTKWRGLVRNACIALGNANVMPGTPAYERITMLLKRLTHSEDGVIAESALWALSRIQPDAARSAHENSALS